MSRTSTPQRLLSGLFLCTLLISGCATMNEDECVTADWYSIGLEDGAAGQHITRLGAHREACAKYGITPHGESYQAGYNEGLNTFCRQSNGFQKGKSGYNYTGICPEHLEEQFLVGYEAGHHLFDLNQKINHSKQLIDQKKYDIKRLKKSTRDKEKLLISDDTSSEDRAALLASLKEQQQSIGSLETEIIELEKRKARLEVNYRQLNKRYHIYY